MLEVLTEPTTIAFVGTFGTAVVLKVSDRFFTVKANEPVAKVVPDVDRNDALYCTAYETRATQAKLVEAGIIKRAEMFVCDNFNCRNCAGTREDIDAEKNRQFQAAMTQSHKDALAWRRELDGYINASTPAREKKKAYKAYQTAAKRNHGGKRHPKVSKFYSKTGRNHFRCFTCREYRPMAYVVAAKPNDVVLCGSCFRRSDFRLLRIQETRTVP